MEDRLDVIDWRIAWDGILDNSLPMSWNLFLALLPLSLSCELFHQPRSPIVRWGIHFLTVITLLPNLGRLDDFTLGLVNQWGLPPLFGAPLWLGAIALVGIIIACVVGLGNQSSRGLVWWIGCLVFILFLPNAAYVLTDIVHFVIDARKGYPMGTVVVILLPQYLLFITTGFQAYVASLMNVGFFLNKRGLTGWICWIELSFHGLTAIGVYLGRFSRFNSWDVLTAPIPLIQTLFESLLSFHNLLVIGVLFGLYAGCYWLGKRITIGLLAQKHTFQPIISSQ